MFGVSLGPSMLRPDPKGDDSRRMAETFGGPRGLLRFLRGLGVTHVELRTIRPDGDPADALACARTVWAAGLSVTVHGELPETDGDFEDVYPSLLPLLAEAGAHQGPVTVTVHPYRSDTDPDTAPLGRRTSAILARWSRDARRLGFRLALENQQKHEHFDPGITCAGVAAMLEGLDAETVGAAFDFGHFYANLLKGAETDPRPPEAFLSRCIHTHIHNFVGRTHMPFGPDGEVPLADYMRRLRAAGYAGVFNLELSFPRFRDLDWRESLRNSIRAVRQAVCETEPKFDRVRASIRAWAEENYPRELARIASELSDPAGPDRCFHLISSSGMVFRAGECVFAVDPALRTAAARDAAGDALRALFEKVPFIFVTHDHDDHFNRATADLLAGLGCRWFIPDFMREDAARTRIPPDRITWIRPGDVIEFPGLRAEVYRGAHFEPNGKGVDEVQLLFEVAGKRVWLPVDVRDYGLDRFPEIEAPDVMVANLWLGRGVSQSPADWAYEEFCDFVAAFAPKRVYIGHLNEYVRESDDIWTYTHAGRALDGLAARMPGTPAECLRLFGCYKLG